MQMLLDNKIYSLIILLLGLHCSLSIPAVNESVPCRSRECVKIADITLSLMNQTVDPCQDFYRFACGGFELRQNISASEGIVSQTTILRKEIMRQLRSLLNRSDSSNETLTSRRKMLRYYKSCLDRETIEKKSAPAMQAMVVKMGGLLLQARDNFSTTWSLNKALSLYDTFASPTGLFSVSIGPDVKNVTENAINLQQGSLILGGGFFYIGKNVTEEPILVALTDFYESMARLVLGNEAPINRSLIVDVLEFEKRRAEIQLEQSIVKDTLANYQKINITWLEANCNFLNWSQYFNDVFRPVNLTIRRDEKRLIMYGVPYFRNLTKLVNEYLRKPHGKRTLQNYFVFRTISTYAERFGGSFFAVISGQGDSQERSEMCVDDTASILGFPLGAIFIERYFSKQAKSRAEMVISETISTFRKRIVASVWMDEQTRAKALDKAAALQYKVAYPDWLLNDTYMMEDRYSKLVITDDYVQNQFIIANYTTMRALAQFNQAPDRSDWTMHVQDVNAYYDPTANVIIVPAGVLGGAFFYAADGVPQALNFGSTGATAGHAITHGFDNTGRWFDKYGNLKEWWADEADGRFRNRSACFVEKFNAYVVDGVSVNGDQTLGENLADDGGLKTAYQAYKRFEANSTNVAASWRKLAGLDKFTPDKLFFLAYAQSWCSIATEETRQFLIETDDHSPERLRVMGPLSNSADFSRAFNCSLGSPMNPAKKCSLW